MGSSPTVGTIHDLPDVHPGVPRDLPDGYNAPGSAAPTQSATVATLLQNYLPILIFLVIAGGFGLLLLVLGWMLGPRRPDAEKVSAYECGFEPFEDSRAKFDVRYYLVAILFIIFDLEIAFLFPWAVSLDEIGGFGLLSMLVFLAVLVIGFIYEWKKGALEWD